MAAKPKPSSVVKVTTQINDQILTYVPAIITGARAAETSNASGAEKKQAVIDAILAGAKAGEAIPSANVAAIAGTIDLVVSVLNALGVFKKR